MIENFGNKRNSNGFDKRPEDAKLGGRKPSINKELQQFANGTGWLEFKKSEVVIEENSIKVPMPNKVQLIWRLLNIAMTGNGTHAVRAIQLVMDKIDQINDNEQAAQSNIDWSKVSLSALKEIVNATKDSNNLPNDIQPIMLYVSDPEHDKSDPIM